MNSSQLTTTSNAIRHAQDSLEAKNFPRGGADEEGFREAFFALATLGRGRGTALDEVEASDMLFGARR